MSTLGNQAASVPMTMPALEAPPPAHRHSYRELVGDDQDNSTIDDDSTS